MKQLFEQYLYEQNKQGSGKAASYLRALELLENMLRAVPLGFEDCRDYRLVLSKSLRDHLHSESLQTHFLSREGQRMELPERFRPLREYLECHRKGGAF